MSEIKLFGNLLCPYAQRVRFAIEGLNIKYDYQDIDLIKNKQREQSYLTINPFGKVPSIRYNDETIYESLPLLEFLENQYGGIFPQDNVRKAQQRIWVAYFDQNIISKQGIFNLIKSKDPIAIKNFANSLAEPIKFLTLHSKLSERIKQNPKSYFEGENLTYFDYATIPLINRFELVFQLFLKTSIFDQIENQDDLIQNFKTYLTNVTSSNAYKRITYNPSFLPPKGDNSVLDLLQYDLQNYDFNTFFETYITKRFLEN